ncbi:MAG: M23/M37 family Peptidase [Candidatus Gottesmanbacteria bacterium GW2011_GWA1_34_13]|uniref:M23/M37 family Peptidase n=1 Tax=Candidatus Gottesmanbacteria bacterium GW2011_GWA1_34_13 TaxID=1618434 RepID=A0A0G0DU50_9BACT|nr:MAG: M23/M37 family Peptidase [Candidatus Gottesmanbacteria bacterium GW2011_GWA1_34_13]
MKRYLLLVLTIVSLYIIVQQVKAAECDPNCGDANECAQKIKICQEIWDSVQKATAPHEASLKKMESDIAAFQARIKQISQEVIVKEREIASGEKELGAQQELLASRVRSAYIRSYTNNPLVLFFSQAGGFGKVMRVISYQQAVTQEDKRQIVETIALIKNIEDKKTNLENEKVTLASLEANLSVQATATKKLVDEAKAYQSKLSSQIGSLTARQQSLLAERSGTFTTSVGDVPLPDDPNSAPNYNPGFSPAFGENKDKISKIFYALTMAKNPQIKILVDKYL